MKSYPIHCKSKTLKRYNSKKILPTDNPLAISESESEHYLLNYILQSKIMDDFQYIHIH